MTPESAFTALRELLHGAGIPSRSPNGASDRERAVTPTRRALPTLLDVAEVFCGALVVVVLVFAWISA